MQISLIAKLIGLFLLYPISINSAFSKNIENQLLANKLETFLNQKKYNLLEDLFFEQSFNKFEKQFSDFRKKYKDTQWSIKTKSNHQNKKFLDIKITARREFNNEIYTLNSKQTVIIQTLRNKIKRFNVITEESILNSQNSPLVIKIIAPDKVLTGQKYEINLIIEEPLDDSVIASGMIVLKNQNNKNISNENFEIKPNLSGGLFKYIKAPLESGSQTISAIITHPKGIYSITKKIKVGL